MIPAQQISRHPAAVTIPPTPKHTARHTRNFPTGAYLINVPSFLVASSMPDSHSSVPSRNKSRQDPSNPLIVSSSIVGLLACCRHLSYSSLSRQDLSNPLIASSSIVGLLACCRHLSYSSLSGIKFLLCTFDPSNIYFLSISTI